MSMGEKIRALRTKSSLTLDQLADAAGLSKAYLWQLENRPSSNPSAAKLDALAKALNVSVGDFLDTTTAEDLAVRYRDQTFFREYEKLDKKAKQQVLQIIKVFQQTHE